jgi:hypothetical protein
LERRSNWRLVFQGPLVAVRPNPNGASHVPIVEEIRHRLATREGAELLGIVRKAEHPQALQKVRLAGVRGPTNRLIRRRSKRRCRIDLKFWISTSRIILDLLP